MFWHDQIRDNSSDVRALRYPAHRSLETKYSFRELGRLCAWQQSIPKERIQLEPFTVLSCSQLYNRRRYALECTSKTMKGDSCDISHQVEDVAYGHVCAEQPNINTPLHHLQAVFCCIQGWLCLYFGDMYDAALTLIYMYFTTYQVKHIRP